MLDEDALDDPQSPVDGIAIDAGYAELAAHALNQLRRAMARGQASVACGWMRLHERLSVLAEAERQAERKAAALARIDAASDAAEDVAALACRISTADPRDAATQTAIDAERSRLDAILPHRSSAKPNEPNTPHAFFTEAEPPPPPFFGNAP